MMANFEPGRGDCLRACIASVMDRPLIEIPNFADDYPDQKWLIELINWLETQGRGVVLAYVGDDDESGPSIGLNNVLAVSSFEYRSRVTGQIVDINKSTHAVVTRIRMVGNDDGSLDFAAEVIHDPSPAPVDLVRPLTHIIIV